MNTVEVNIDRMLAFRGRYGHYVDEVIVRVAVHIESALHHIDTGMPPKAARFHRDTAKDLVRCLNGRYADGGVLAVIDAAWDAIYKLEEKHPADLLQTFGDIPCIQCGATVKGVPVGMSALCLNCNFFTEQIESGNAERPESI